MPKLTNKCAVCGKPILKSWTICEECREKQNQQEQEIQIEIAKTRARLIPEVLWEKRRYEIAKDVLSAFLSDSSGSYCKWSMSDQVSRAVDYADLLIRELERKEQ